MTAERARRFLPLATAAVGVVLAHAADYTLVYPDPGQRTRELSATGHGYWPLAIGVAAAFGAAALVAAALRGARSRPAAMPSVLRLAVLQLGLFTAIEVVERVSVGVSPVPFLHSAPFAVGLALQVVTAGACALVLRQVERAARAVAALFRARRERRRAISWALPGDEPVAVWWAFTTGARGPPVPSSS